MVNLQACRDLTPNLHTAYLALPNLRLIFVCRLILDHTPSITLMICARTGRACFALSCAGITTLVYFFVLHFAVLIEIGVCAFIGLFLSRNPVLLGLFVIIEYGLDNLYAVIADSAFGQGFEAAPQYRLATHSKIVAIPRRGLLSGNGRRPHLYLVDFRFGHVIKQLRVICKSCYPIAAE